MMRPSSITVSTSGLSVPVPLDRYVNGYSLAVTMRTPGAIYTLQYTLDDPYDTYTTSYNVSGAWFNWDDPLLVNASTNRSTNLAFPPAAIRLNVTSGVSAGRPLTLRYIPMGMDAN